MLQQGVLHLIVLVLCITLSLTHAYVDIESGVPVPDVYMVSQPPEPVGPGNRCKLIKTTARCPYIYQPLCGSDHVTYPNKCSFDLENQYRRCMRLKHLKYRSGSCGTRRPQGCERFRHEPCTKEYKPICGSDEVTYSNLCSFRKTNKYLSCMGRPTLTGTAGKCATPLPPDYDPLCSSDDLSGTGDCAPITCETLRTNLCTMEYNPQCGSDGKTYGNPCLLMNEQEYYECKDLPTLTATPGECSESDTPSTNCEDIRNSPCTMEYRPLCGSDDKIYGNDCSFGIELEYRRCKGMPPLTSTPGECGSAPPSCETLRTKLCTMEYNPQCGSDGKTYGNLCMLRKEQEYYQCKDLPPLTATPGECSDLDEPRGRSAPDCESIRHRLCTMDYRPLCGSDGKTYGNPCSFGIEQEYRRCKGMPPLTSTPGECGSAPPSCETLRTKVCTMEYNPQCGSDGKTYGNLCMLRKEQEYYQCKHFPPLTATPGECSSLNEPRDRGAPDCESIRHRLCTMDYRPLCGSDGKTYGNTCSFGIEQEYRRCKGMPPLTSTPGECGSAPPSCETLRTKVCTMEYNPHCGSDGKTYGNLCMLRKEQEYYQCKGFPPLTATPGECSSLDEPRGRSAPDCESIRNSPCTMDYRPLCGSDGKTYGNTCSFKIEQEYRRCKGMPPLTSTPGECGKIITPSPNCEGTRNTACTMEYNPICASDGKTYGNPCSLGIEQAYRKCKGMPALLSRSGECRQECEDIKNRPCTMELNPQCGSDGVTYPNPCTFRTQQDCNICQGFPPLTATPGACSGLDGPRGRSAPDCESIRKRLCTMDYRPLCGSDGKTYGNNCSFNIEQEYRRCRGMPPLTSIPGECEISGKMCPKLPGTVQCFVSPCMNNPCGSGKKCCDDYRRGCNYICV